ncbi:integrase/recombinase XerD [Virgibacillus natechei]|uniref:Integrase/recombinase XerD n=1 Tax=Virgibacillus natechei TaxID=1216297 RepID=A0ABS4IGF4_9BACI|nr:tyrosine-type recombinase/integrase [Virgibacillus natechei]MBP1970027.1 integrase/recombinase XerD [Virgibacillus natechei]UZD13319.1 tyrosine-type recombinase/integrase [Virgibacillus natechei]
MLLRFAYKEFYSDKELEGLRKRTLEGYTMFFDMFLDWCDQRELKHIEEVTPRVVKGFLSYCKTERGNNPTSLNTKLKYFRTFFSFLVAEGLLDSNPTKTIKTAKEDISIQSFSDSEINQILSHLRRNKRKENDFHAVRNYSIFVTLLGTGVRIGELVNLKWSDIHFKEGYITVFGKTRRQEAIPMIEKVANELGFWKSYCESSFDNLNPYIFVNRQNKTITVNAIKCFFKRLSAIMEMKGVRVSAHTLRHTFARKFIENGGDVSVLSRILRHQNLQTTSRYLKFFSNKLAEDNDKYNALRDISL